ncbi:MAG: primosomal protein N' [Prevotella sp.]|jgi:primosomal protein N' (replication factor Y)|nr:primosomal protein N' [Prevotella sp.]MCH4183792.1 primosomal protein N' [Prevotella sp.]
MKFVDVILPLPLDSLFTYSVPEIFDGKVQVGVRVLVPLGRSKKYVAVVVKSHDDQPKFRCKPILELLDDIPILLIQQLRLWQWISDYYISPIGDVFSAAMPVGLKSLDKYKPKLEIYVGLAESYRNETALRVALNMLVRAVHQQKVFIEYLALSHWDTIESTTTREPVIEITREELMNSCHCTLAQIKALSDRGILYLYKKEVGRLNHAGMMHPERIQSLNEAQQTALDQILEKWKEKDVVLLHGVTSSGKTEIYIHLIAETIKKHQQVLYLLPEIALTVQMMERLQRVFGSRLGIYHSKYSDAERVEIWKKQLSSHPYDVILGARSAVFLPFQNLGLVIVDEEQETSFKQQDPAPRYHARDVSIVLAKMYGARTLLGTATPSMESYYNTRIGKYGLVSLATRYHDIQLPEIRVVDIKDLRHRKMMTGPFSPSLLAAIRKALDNGQQVILFQNRRGFSPMIECRACGWTPKCVNCDVSLTLHKNLNQLVCHYCGMTYKIPVVCPNCGSTELRGIGYGTEKIEDQVRDIFPDARVARMDLDTTRTRHAYERIINDFAAGRTNLLIGTQMVSKGLDFDHVSVVGILDADSMLNYPDFRAYEHAFMMMSQVSGRAGRKGEQGLVLLQTKNPELPVIQQVVRHDYKGFYRTLIVERKTFHYPPFYRLINVFLKHKNEKVVQQAAKEVGDHLHVWFGNRVLGPDRPSVSRVNAMEIRKLVIKLENGIDQKRVRECLIQLQKRMQKDSRYGALSIYYDVDPL